MRHEGLAFDRYNNLCYIDELNGGSIYRYSSATPTHGSTCFGGGTNAVLRVGDGNTANAIGAFNWVPFTSASGAGLGGAVTITDPRGVSSVDAAAALAATRAVNAPIRHEASVGLSKTHWTIATARTDCRISEALQFFIGLIDNSDVLDASALHAGPAVFGSVGIGTTTVSVVAAATCTSAAVSWAGHCTSIPHVVSTLACSRADPPGPRRRAPRESTGLPDIAIDSNDLYAA